MIDFAIYMLAGLLCYDILLLMSGSNWERIISDVRKITPHKPSNISEFALVIAILITIAFWPIILIRFVLRGFK